MKIVEINGTNYSSTGNIMLNIAKQARLEGFEVFTCCKKSRKSEQFNYDNQVFIGSRIERLVSEQLAAITGRCGSFNWFSTRKFIKKLKEIKPDLVHLHILHDTYINQYMLFKYLMMNDIPVVWTFHDCWAFTGKCPYFESKSCENWKNGCYDCPQVKSYPISYCLDRTKLMWKKKKELFTSLDKMTIVTPSKWLSNYVKKSFLNKYDVRVINNGINLDVFKPTISNFREKHNLQDKYVILGVGYNWAPRKGLDDFIKLANDLNDNYKIVLIGTDENIDKNLPVNVISIHRTYDQKELVDIYSSCDLFVNPTREDNYPTVNMEAIACGLPVLTYDTGGSAEIPNAKSGSVVKRGDYDSLLNEIIRISKEKSFNKNDILQRAKSFNMNDKFKEYIDLYKEVLN